MTQVRKTGSNPTAKKGRSMSKTQQLPVPKRTRGELRTNVMIPMATVFELRKSILSPPSLSIHGDSRGPREAMPHTQGVCLHGQRLTESLVGDVK